MPDPGGLQELNPDRFRVVVGQPIMKVVLTTGNDGYNKLAYCDVPIPRSALARCSVQFKLMDSCS